MNAQTAKITPGKCEARFIWACVCGHQGGYWNVFMENGEQIPKLSEADAKFIAEAFNVCHETGLSPRQLADALKEEKFERQQVCAALTREVIKTEKLADQRAELLDVLEAARAWIIEAGSCGCLLPSDEILAGICNSIQRATGEQP